jgi:aryl-alcohol dehydrogenase-like predicted oxidoreductase
MSTPMRRLGRTGLSVSELGYGAWGIGKSMWVGADDETSLGALREAIEQGVRFIDTAMAYGDGHSEELVGAAVRASGEEVVIATKIPPKNQSWPARAGDEVGEMYPGSWIVECTERSLSSLGLGTVDVQQLHTWTDDWVGKGDWAQAVATLKEQGKIRFFGVSIRNFDPASVLELIRSGLVDTVQVIYNVFEQAPAQELFPAAREHDVGIIVRVPFDEGGLTGRVRPDTEFPDGDFRERYFREDRREQTWRRVEAIVAELGIELDELPAIALRFCLSDPAVSTVIPGMRTAENVHRNLAAVEQGPLGEPTLELLRRHAWQRPPDW